MISRDEIRGELALWSTYLQLGVSDATAYLKKVVRGIPVSEGPQAQAWRWVQARGTQPLGFTWACQIFGIHPDNAIAQIRRNAEAD